MSEVFRKGQMVPKRLGFVSTHRKTQCHVTFGCDVEICGNVIKALSDPSTGVFVCNTFRGRVRKNGTIQRFPYKFSSMHIDCNNLHGTKAFTVKC